MVRTFAGIGGCVPAALAAVSLLASAEALAFSAPGHKWDRAASPVHYRIHPDGASDITDGADLEAVRKAFGTWAAVTCSYLRFEEKSWVEPPKVANDATNRIFWATTRQTWPGQSSTLALTYTFYRTQDGVVTDADIVVNGVDWQWTTAEGMVGQRRVDVESVLLHEIGHFFGLDHSSETNAVMFAQSNAPTRRAPSNDDVAAICTLYGNGQPIPNSANPSQAGSVGAPCQSHENCSSAQCAQDQGLSYCTKQCTLGDASSCPVQYPCTRTHAGEFCLLPVQVDELCDQCTDGRQCQTGLCLDVPGYNYFKPFCTRACDPTPGGVSQCPENYHCEAVQSFGQTGGVCAPNSGICDPAGRGGHNEPCFANGACKPGHACIQFAANTGLNYCYLECSPQAAGGSCSETERVVCLNIDPLNSFGRMNVAACQHIAGVAQPCMPEVCQEGSICAFDEASGLESAVCYQTCPSGSCPANTQCRAFSGLGNVCVPNAGYKPLGDRCLSNAECESKMCRTFGSTQLCTQKCATTDSDGCDPGLRCIAETNSSSGLCWPESSSLPNLRGAEVVLPDGYCACDSTVQCDEDCECDPECLSRSCGCTALAGPRATPSWFSVGMFVLMLVLRPRVRSRRG